MQWNRVRAATLAFLVPFAFVACESLGDLDDLDVTNENNPDAERALGTPGDIEALIGSAFSVWIESTANFGDGPLAAMTTMADELSMSWGNGAMLDLSREPRIAYNNSSAYGYSYVNDDGWRFMYRALSGVYDALRAFEDDPTLGEQIDLDRARTFGKFMQGLAHGWLALQFDSAFVFDETVDLETDALELRPYPDVMTAALGYLNEVIQDAPGADWDLPAGWINGNALSGPELAELAHSFSARFMVHVARTPNERANNTNWQAVINHVDAGITSDFSIQATGSAPWWDDLKWLAGQLGSTWGRADYKTIGFTEVGADLGYDNWLQTAVGSRLPFKLQVPDRRVTPPGAPPHDSLAYQPAGEGLDFGFWGQPSHPEARGTYHWSFYGHHRYREHPESGQTNRFDIMVTEEMDLLKAEALLRLGQAGAAALVNQTRVTRGQLLPATDGDADLFDKIWYEMMIENFAVCGGCAYYYRRSAGPLAPTGPSHHLGLVRGTLLHFPLPGSEIEILQKKPYSYGGEGEEGGTLAPSGAPAFGVGDAASGTRVPARLVYAFDHLNSVSDKLEALRKGWFEGAGKAELNRYH